MTISLKQGLVTKLTRIQEEENEEQDKEVNDEIKR
jgi:hypothetical protein